jgi:hypothetical protein
MPRDPEIEKLDRLLRDRMIEREMKARADRLRVAAVVAILSTVSAIVAGFQFFDVFKEKPSLPVISVGPEAVVALRGDVQALKKEMADIRAAATAPHNVPPDSVLAAEQAKQAASVQGIEKRLSALEAAILESPERALSIPLLRKEVVDSSKRSEEYRLSIRTEIDRLYEQQKWMLGGIGAVLVAIAGGAVTIVLKSLPKEKETEKDA